MEKPNLGINVERIDDNTLKAELVGDTDILKEEDNIRWFTDSKDKVEFEDQHKSVAVIKTRGSCAIYCDINQQFLVREEYRIQDSLEVTVKEEE